MRTITAFLLLTFGTVPAAFAAPDPAEIRCGTKFSEPKEIERCLAEALAEAEQQLARAQEQLRNSLRQARPRFNDLHEKTLDAIESMLSKAQDAWRAFRDSQCEYLRDLHGAIGEDALEYTACGLKMVKARTRELLDEARFWSEKFPAKE
jgi:uncharacterized protein YecT (DUF1311 family)